MFSHENTLDFCKIHYRASHLAEQVSRSMQQRRSTLGIIPLPFSSLLVPPGEARSYLPPPQSRRVAEAAVPPPPLFPPPSNTPIFPSFLLLPDGPEDSFSTLFPLHLYGVRERPLLCFFR